ncbi:MAG: ATPase domain-containing protein [Desulfurococcaceae archaeon]
MQRFVFGIEDLDKLLGTALVENTLMVIAGHPGSGKTSLASTICYNNALMGVKCLYISSQEDRDKLYRNMKKLGIDLEEIEKRNCFKFIKLPITVTEEGAEKMFMDAVNKYVIEFKPQVIVIDSATPFLKAMGAGIKARAILQNFFTELPRVANGLVILIAEIPLSENRVELGDIEFVADFVVILTHKVERGLITRLMEIRKVRGSPLTMAEIPFSIRENEGISVFISPVLGEIHESLKQLKIPCEKLVKALNYLYKGDVIYLEYPAHHRHHQTAILIPLISLVNDMKILFISYKYSPLILRTLFESIITNAGNVDLKNKFLGNVVFKGINPFAYSVVEINSLENKIVEDVKPDMVVFHGVEIPMSIYKLSTYVPHLYNQLLIFKNKGILAARYASFINNEISSINASLADVVFKVITELSGMSLKTYIYAWRRGFDPAVLAPMDIKECIDQITG